MPYQNDKVKAEAAAIFKAQWKIAKTDPDYVKMKKEHREKIDNADFFALDDISKISDEELYDRLLTEFPDWMKEARAKGILA